MTGEHVFGLLIVVIATIVIASIKFRETRHRIKLALMDRLHIGRVAKHGQRHGRRKPATNGGAMAAIEKSKAELEMLQKHIADRKQIAMETDISYHLWDFYKNHFRSSSAQTVEGFLQEGEWYDVKILQSSTRNGFNTFEFELKGTRYKFVDDEENQGWGDNTKLFSLFLYDDSDRCLIEIPMKVKIDRWGRQYSIWSDGPKAFLPGGWVNDFISVKLKHQLIRNKEIREQKHQERLWEIEDLKKRFGIPD
jgi:hypothetical protein